MLTLCDYIMYYMTYVFIIMYKPCEPELLPLSIKLNII